MLNNVSEIPVVVLSGGHGVYIDDSGLRKAKGNLLIHGKPLIAYVLQSYLQAGFRKFQVSGSYQLEETRELLLQVWPTLQYGGDKFELDFTDSGKFSQTGTRLRKVSDFAKKASHFAITYSDSISTIDLAQNLALHVNGDFEGTFTAVRLPTRFRIVGMRPGENVVRGFSEKPLFRGDYINGGFYFFKSSVLDLEVWKSKDEVVLETDVLDALVKKNELNCIPYEGSWHYLDCERDIKQLETICEAIESQEAER